MAFFCFAKPTFSIRCTLLVLAFALLGISACKDDDKGPKEPNFNPGILIANEGPFQNGTGTVTFWDRATGETSQDVFAAANGGAPVGNILQSVRYHNDLIYLVVNNGAKVVVVDAATFKQVAEIKGLAQPRYILPVSDNKACVSQWGADGLTGSVAIVNLNTFTVEKTIPTGSGPEHMLQAASRLYVANSGGGFGGIDSTIAIVDLNTGTLLSKITVGTNPNSMTVDKTGAIWVGCSGFTDWADPANPLNAPGSLVKVVDGEAVLTLALPEQAYDLIINPAGDRLFYLSNNYGGNIHAHSIDQPTVHPAPFVAGAFYALGFDHVEGALLAADAKDFQSNGEVKVFDLSGTAKRAIPAGIIPGSFWILE